MTEIHYCIVIYVSSSEENSKVFFDGDSGKKEIIFYFFFAYIFPYFNGINYFKTFCLISTASPAGGGRLVDQRSDGDHTKSESEQRLVF